MTCTANQRSNDTQPSGTPARWAAVWLMTALLVVGLSACATPIVIPDNTDAGPWAKADAMGTTRDGGISRQDRGPSSQDASATGDLDNLGDAAADGMLDGLTDGMGEGRILTDGSLDSGDSDGGSAPRHDATGDGS